MLAFALQAHADAEHDGAVWIVNQAAVPLGERVSLHAMVQNRFTEDAATYQRTVLRPWIAYTWPEGFEAAIGYDAHLFESPNSIAEQRAWQRLAYQHDFGPVQGLTDESVAFRLRWSIGGAVALPWETTLVARNEFFFDLNTTSRIRARKLGEDQLIVQLQRELFPGVRLDGGYLMQFLDGPDDLYNHTFAIGFAVTPLAWGSGAGVGSDDAN